MNTSVQFLFWLCVTGGIAAWMFSTNSRPTQKSEHVAVKEFRAFTAENKAFQKNAFLETTRVKNSAVSYHSRDTQSFSLENYLNHPEIDEELVKVRMAIGADASPNVMALMVSNRVLLEPSEHDFQAAQESMRAMHSRPDESLMDLLSAMRRLDSLVGSESQKQLLFEVATHISEQHPINQRILEEITNLFQRHQPIE